MNEYLVLLFTEVLSKIKNQLNAETRHRTKTAEQIVKVYRQNLSEKSKYTANLLFLFLFLRFTLL